MITVLQNQSLFDIAVQNYGNAQCAFDLALANDFPLNKSLKAGQQIKEISPDSISFGEGRGVAHRQIAEYYRTRGLKPATALQSLKQEN